MQSYCKALACQKFLRNFLEIFASFAYYGSQMAIASVYYGMYAC